MRGPVAVARCSHGRGYVGPGETDAYGPRDERGADARQTLARDHLAAFTRSIFLTEPFSRRVDVPNLSRLGPDSTEPSAGRPRRPASVAEASPAEAEAFPFMVIAPGVSFQVAVRETRGRRTAGEFASPITLFPKRSRGLTGLHLGGKVRCVAQRSGVVVTAT